MHVKPLNPMQRALAINLSGTYYIFSLLSLPPFSLRPSGHYHPRTYLLPSLALLPISSLASSLSPAFLDSCVSIGLVILFSYLIHMDYLRSSILAISDQCHHRSRRHRTYRIFPELPIYYFAIYPSDLSVLSISSISSELSEAKFSYISPPPWTPNQHYSSARRWHAPHAMSLPNVALTHTIRHLSSYAWKPHGRTTPLVRSV